MWSGPRNLSTAMMRSFENRADCKVWDEPFFAPFLKATGLDHPGRVGTLAAHETDPVTVAKHCAVDGPDKWPLFFQKHMPHHMIEGFPRDWMKSCRHFFLLRDPAAVIASYAKSRPYFTIEDIGVLQQVQMFDEITDWQGNPPPVVDSDDILEAPEAMLRLLCDAIDIPFDPDMLGWPAGKRDTDGAWAPYWYKSVENSTGFGLPRPGRAHVPKIYAPILDQCRPAYERLHVTRLNKA